MDPRSTKTHPKEHIGQEIPSYWVVGFFKVCLEYEALLLYFHPITFLSLFARILVMMILYKQPIKEISIKSPNPWGLSFFGTRVGKDMLDPQGKCAWRWNSLVALTISTLITSQQVVMKLKLKPSDSKFLSLSRCWIGHFYQIFFLYSLVAQFNKIHQTQQTPRELLRVNSRSWHLTMLNSRCWISKF